MNENRQSVNAYKSECACDALGTVKWWVIWTIYTSQKGLRKCLVIRCEVPTGVNHILK